VTIDGASADDLAYDRAVSPMLKAAVSSLVKKQPLGQAAVDASMG
jgi:hypothetical protein